MGIINDVNVIKSDIEDTQKCNKIQFSFIYHATNSANKRIIDLFNFFVQIRM